MGKNLTNRRKSRVRTISLYQYFKQLNLDAKYTHKSELIMEAEQNEEAMLKAKYEKVWFYQRKKYYKY